MLEDAITKPPERPGRISDGLETFWRLPESNDLRHWFCRELKFLVNRYVDNVWANCEHREQLCTEY